MTDKERTIEFFKKRDSLLLGGNDIHWPVLALQRILKEVLSIVVDIKLLMRYNSRSKILQVVFSDGSILLLTTYYSIANDGFNIWMTTSEDIENLCKKMVVMFTLTQDQIFNIERLTEELKVELTA